MASLFLPRGLYVTPSSHLSTAANGDSEVTPFPEGSFFGIQMQTGYSGVTYRTLLLRDGKTATAEELVKLALIDYSAPAAEAEIRKAFEARDLLECRNNWTWEQCRRRYLCKPRGEMLRGCCNYGGLHVWQHECGNILSMFFEY